MFSSPIMRPMSSQPGRPIEFPDKEEGFPDDFARLLFRMSSPLPDKMKQVFADAAIYCMGN